MIPISFDEWQRWSQTYSMLPYIMKYDLGEHNRVLSWEKAWEHATGIEGTFVLESGKNARYSYLGLDPVASIEGDNQQARVTRRDGTVEAWDETPLSAVKRWMKPYRSPRVEGLPKFIGGCAGFWSYDVVRTIEKLPSIAKDDLPLPAYRFLMIDELWIIDHEEQMLICAYHTHIEGQPAEDQLRALYDTAETITAQMLARWQAITATSDLEHSVRDRAQMLREDKDHNRVNIDVESIAGVYTEFSKADYLQTVHHIQDYIRAGDVFQVNLSVRQSKPLSCKPELIYEWLRHLNPSPYMGLLRFSDYQIICGSPELLVQLEHNKIRTRPIAGTRPRGQNDAEDQRLSEELLGNEKERAEHIMLVDLARNDVGRIARYGTVRVNELMTVEMYSHVMHIVSEVTGELADNRDAYDVLAATFPCGTITGAPKIRTMEIIEELEPVRRGLYTGSIGWIDYNGDMEFNIVIRTLIVADGVGHIQAGAGIVIDSDPEREYTESLNKAKALWKSVQYASTASAIANKE
jgi:para-aminobenzoate synthetase component 1